MAKIYFIYKGVYCECEGVAQFILDNATIITEEEFNEHGQMLIAEAALEENDNEQKENGN